MVSVAAIIRSALILICCSFCATEVQAVGVTGAHTGVFNGQQGDGEWLNRKAMRRKEASLDHTQGETSPSISPTTSSGNCSACPPWHHHSPSASGNDTVCHCACGHSLGGVVECNNDSVSCMYLPATACTSMKMMTQQL